MVARPSRGSRLPTVLTFVLALAACGEGSAPAPELILHGGTVYTADADGSVIQAVAIRDGRFVAVGPDDEVRALAGPETDVRDLGGRAVLPGLGDDHFHAAGGGPGVELSDARTLQEVLDAIAAAAQEKDPGELIVTQSDWHEGQLDEQRLPYRDDLDAAAPNHPVVVVRGGHEYILNSAALERFGIDRSTEVPDAEGGGGRIGRYEDGRLNGELIDAAQHLVELDPADAGAAPEGFDEQVERLKGELRTVSRAGLTFVRYAGAGPEKWRALKELRDRGELPVRVQLLFRLSDEDATGAALDSALSTWGVEPGQGDEWLGVGGVKLGVDGGFEGGLMRDPYEEPWGQGGSFHGARTVHADSFRETARELSRRGWRVATHAVGDSAIDLVLRAYAAADSVRSIRERRWVVEHAFVPREDHYPVMRELGLVASLQNHLYVAAPSLVSYWGRERAERTSPMALFLKEGVPVAAGTDSPVIPYNPFWVLYHFATRGTISAGTMGEPYAVSRYEALRAATWGNAYLAGQEDLRGTIEEGKLADLVVISQDIMQVPVDRMEETEALLTVVGGEVVYEAGEMAGSRTRPVGGS